jgi:branched-chain amino acid transport system ATP-binding protein
VQEGEGCEGEGEGIGNTSALRWHHRRGDSKIRRKVREICQELADEMERKAARGCSRIGAPRERLSETFPHLHCLAASVNILEVKGVEKSFGNLRALDGVSLGVEGGKITVLIGPNGSGKTTLVNVISGFYKADEGEIFYNSKRITGQSPYRIYDAGLVRTFQIPSLFWKLTVLENILTAEKANPGEKFFKAPFRGSWNRHEEAAVERAADILELLGLSEHWNKESSLLSGGQMKLLEIGRALASGAKMLILDEPISGVNPTLAHEIFSTITRLRDELGLTFLIVEHRLEITFQYTDTVLAMALGKLVASGTPDTIVNNEQVIEAYLGK